ncbi:hypothetical protein GPA10_37245 [Streptomyces sp. p1417]|uniref:Core-binding (CB) domain-containing protein n=1 Tax=Streptomyces typhae TaxID=2681492 RepID=A0A6L6X9V3_9ACTN|nr:hypothetical protein [Streptomyces typhae]MVO90250.1 hypothetical protein [Streptomyces typhae]
MLAETEIDVDGAAMAGGDQLWFGREIGPRLRTLDARYPGARRKGRYASKRRLAQEAEQAARSVSAHLTDPGQLELFDTPARDWTGLDEAELPALTEQAAAVLDDFTAYIRRRGWKIGQLGASIRTLRILAAYLGIAAPIRETDIRAVAGLSHNHQGARVINYLRRRGLLISDEPVDTYVAKARSIADRLPATFSEPVHVWIDVLVGQGSKPSQPLGAETIQRYTRYVAPVLLDWANDGLGGPREVTREHIEAAIEPLRGSTARGVHVGLRSMFRALRRERLIFRDPARTVELAIARRLPRPLPSDRLTGLLNPITDARGRLIVSLVAVHALFPRAITQLLLEDLDRARGQQRVRRVGRPDHVIYLDDLTMELATAWIAERYRRWPDCANPYLIVSRETAIDDLHRPASSDVIGQPFRTVGLRASELRQDRIFDEARHTADPVHLMRVFGLSDVTAMKYVAAAHPDKRADPIQA